VNPQFLLTAHSPYGSEEHQRRLMGADSFPLYLLLSVIGTLPGDPPSFSLPLPSLIVLPQETSLPLILNYLKFISTQHSPPSGHIITRIECSSKRGDNCGLAHNSVLTRSAPGCNDIMRLGQVTRHSRSPVLATWEATLTPRTLPCARQSPHR
jgi:hypothetical protein